LAKEFKDFDKEYASLRRTDEMESADDRHEASLLTRWDIIVQSWPSDFIRECVYGVGCEEWQKFRVSLKGQSTRMKLWRLKMLYVDKCYKLEHKPEYAGWRCRIDNYVGALVRGGLLESGTYRVLK